MIYACSSVESPYTTWFLCFHRLIVNSTFAQWIRMSSNVDWSVAPLVFWYNLKLSFSKNWSLCCLLSPAPVVASAVKYCTSPASLRAGAGGRIPETANANWCVCTFYVQQWYRRSEREQTHAPRAQSEGESAIDRDGVLESTLVGV
jgi:hypothetical protein